MLVKNAVLSAYRYAWLTDRDCGISFIYSKNNKIPNTDPWGNPQFRAPAPENTLSDKNSCLWGKNETTLLFGLENLCTSLYLIKF